jgi:hypothetical protein
MILALDDIINSWNCNEGQLLVQKIISNTWPMKNRVVLFVEGYSTKYQPLFKGFSIFCWECQICYSGNNNFAVSLSEQSELSKMVWCLLPLVGLHHCLPHHRTSIIRVKSKASVIFESEIEFGCTEALREHLYTKTTDVLCYKHLV